MNKENEAFYADAVFRHDKDWRVIVRDEAVAKLQTYSFRVARFFEREGLFPVAEKALAEEFSCLFMWAIGKMIQPDANMGGVHDENSLLPDLLDEGFTGDEMDYFLNLTQMVAMPCFGMSLQGSVEIDDDGNIFYTDKGWKKYLAYQKKRNKAASNRDIKKPMDEQEVMDMIDSIMNPPKEDKEPENEE